MNRDQRAIRVLDAEVRRTFDAVRIEYIRFDARDSASGVPSWFVDVGLKSVTDFPIYEERNALTSRAADLLVDMNDERVPRFIFFAPDEDVVEDSEFDDESETEHSPPVRS